MAEQLMLNGVGKSFLVLSGKGGVGKSTVAVQIATSLASHGYQVGLLDLDLCGPSIPRMVGLEGHSVMSTSDGKWIPVPVEKHENLRVISIAFFLENRDSAVIWRGPKKNAMVKEILTKVKWNVDYLVIDTPPGTSDENISVMENLRELSSKGAVLVTTPQMVAVDDMKREVTFCRKGKIPILGIIENMSGFSCPNCLECYNIFAAGGGSLLAESAGVPFLGRIPIDGNLSACLEDGKDYFAAYSNSKVCEIVHEIVRKLTPDAKMDTD